MKVLLKIATIWILLFWHLVSMAQTEATMKLDTNTILVGDQTELELRFSCPSNFEVNWPVFADTLIREIEIIKKTAKETVPSEDKTQTLYLQRLTITSFDSGYYAIPPISFQYRKPGDSSWYRTETEPVLLGVNTVPVNLQGEIKDIKPPEHAPFTFREALPYILILLGAGLVTFLVIWYLRKRKKAEPIFRMASKPQLPPHQIALDALQTLRLKKLWQNGNIKEYHTELTDIIRDYLQSKFRMQAHEYTSEEIMEAVQQTAVNAQAQEKLRQTLSLADMVKFAKMQPLPLEHDTSLNNAVDFVKETMHLGMNGHAKTEDNAMHQGDMEKKEPDYEQAEITSPIEKDTEAGKEVKDV
ncbi:MAG: hypothetical protein KQI35_12390 [Bacteroidetes bacterium]|nr:hypothetical protein [Bacteroidota bacterium]